MTVRAGSDLVLDAAVGGRPDPKASWSKGNRDLELCEKYHLQYTPTKAMAIIKFCDRDDTGKYILTVRNVSGTKTAEVNVQVLGKYQSLGSDRFIYILFIRNLCKKGCFVEVIVNII